MSKRFPKIFTSFISVLIILTACIQSAHSQDATTGIQGGQLCPNNEFITPVLVTGLQDIDSISLTLNFPAQTLTFKGFRQVNPILQTGFIAITGLPGQVKISWHSDAPVSINEGKICDLIFDSGNEPGSLTWDETVCYYRKSDGAELGSVYVGNEVTFFPALSVVIEEIDKTCAGQCEANIAAFVSGGTRPFEYLWNGLTEPFDSIKTKACGGYNNLNITDFNGCVLDTNFIVSELPATKIEVEFTPDTVYMQNPVVGFSFSEELSIVEWAWDFGDGTEKSRERNPVHLYASAKTPDLESYMVTLVAINEQGCDTTIVIEIPVAEVELFIPNVFTPPTDPNGYFRIAKKNDGSSSGSEYIPIQYEYQRMELIVLDRWGRKVYDDSNYKNDWDGDNLPDGTYYYKLNTFGYFQDKSYTGAVTIIREK